MSTSPSVFASPEAPPQPPHTVHRPHATISRPNPLKDEDDIRDLCAQNEERPVEEARPARCQHADRLVLVKVDLVRVAPVDDIPRAAADAHAARGHLEHVALADAPGAIDADPLGHLARGAADVAADELRAVGDRLLEREGAGGDLQRVRVDGPGCAGRCWTKCRSASTCRPASRSASSRRQTRPDRTARDPRRFAAPGRGTPAAAGCSPARTARRLCPAPSPPAQAGPA
eukprot:6554295-Prymnesium_polylepis.1